MERFFGFDLGDAESAVAVLKKGSKESPEMLSVAESQSLITAYAILKDRSLVIGENACYDPDASVRRLRFKSRFLKDKESAEDIRRFASGVLGDLYTSSSLIQGEDACFYVGCPAGWDKNARERYRQIFELTGYPPTRIVSESRAALVGACRSKHLQVGYDILQKPVLVVDIGSSTTDFAYIRGGKEVELKTAGEVALGGGLMDEMLLEESLKNSPNEAKLRKIFSESDAWRTYAEFACRRLKEKYYKDEAYFKENECSKTLRISYRLPVKLTIKMDEEISKRLLEKRSPICGGKSFKEAFVESLHQIHEALEDEKMPELVFLTGGVSKMPVMSDWLREAFPEAVVIMGSEPEFSVARGLSWCGQIDEDVRAFRQEIQDLKDSTTVERLVADHIDELFRAAVDTLTDPLLEEAVLPVVLRWKSGEIEKLSDIDGQLRTEVDAYLHTDRARALLQKPVAKWLKQIAYELEEYTIPICTRHQIPYQTLNLNSYLSGNEVEIKVDTKDVFAVEEVTILIDMIITVVVGLLCGGGGIALIAEGLPGIAAGMVVSLLVLLLGKKSMEKAILNANLPKLARKLLPESYLRSRLKAVSGDVKAAFYESLEKDKNEAIEERMTEEISRQIDDCLVKMAEVVELPL